MSKTKTNGVWKGVFLGFFVSVFFVVVIQSTPAKLANYENNKPLFIDWKFDTSVLLGRIKRGLL